MTDVSRDAELAIKVAAWLTTKSGSPAAVETLDTGVVVVHYALGGRVQPTVRVNKGGVVFPAGSDFDLVMAFLENK